MHEAALRQRHSPRVSEMGSATTIESISIHARSVYVVPEHDVALPPAVGVVTRRRDVHHALTTASQPFLCTTDRFRKLFLFQSSKLLYFVCAEESRGAFAKERDERGGLSVVWCLTCMMSLLSSSSRPTNRQNPCTEPCTARSPVTGWRRTSGVSCTHTQRTPQTASLSRRQARCGE